MENAALNAEERQFLLARQDMVYKACQFFGRLEREGRMPEELDVILFKEVEQCIVPFAHPLYTENRHGLAATSAARQPKQCGHTVSLS
jgi:hypothetical protein